MLVSSRGGRGTVAELFSPVEFKGFDSPLFHHGEELLKNY